jgi:hypothetical protein
VSLPDGQVGTAVRKRLMRVTARRAALQRHVEGAAGLLADEELGGSPIVVDKTKTSKALVFSPPCELAPRGIRAALLTRFPRAFQPSARPNRDFSQPGSRGPPMRLGDFVDHPAGAGAYLVAHEKGGKARKLPAHHVVVDTLRAYLEAGGLLEGDKKAPLFQSAPARSGTLSGQRLHQNDMRAMVKRRCADAGLPADIGCHSLRATGITTHQENGGRIEDAARLAGHADVRTTALYDRSKKNLDRSEVERVQF